jgi:hypothetical protein
LSVQAELNQRQLNRQGAKDAKRTRRKDKEPGESLEFLSFLFFLLGELGVLVVQFFVAHDGFRGGALNQPRQEE